MKQLSALSFAAILAAPDWPTLMTTPRKLPTPPAPVPDTMDAHAARLAQPQSKRARRRAAGKSKAASHGQV